MSKTYLMPTRALAAALYFTDSERQYLDGAYLSLDEARTNWIVQATNGHTAMRATIPVESPSTTPPLAVDEWLFINTGSIKALMRAVKRGKGTGQTGGGNWFCELADTGNPKLPFSAKAQLCDDVRVMVYPNAICDFTPPPFERITQRGVGLGPPEQCNIGFMAGYMADIANACNTLHTTREAPALRLEVDNRLDASSPVNWTYRGPDCSAVFVIMPMRI